MNPRNTSFALFGTAAIGRMHPDRLQRGDRVLLEGIANAVESGRAGVQRARAPCFADHGAPLEAPRGAPHASDTLVLPVNEGRNES